MPRTWETVSSEEMLRGIAAAGSAKNYAEQFGVTDRCLKYELHRRGIVLKKGRKRSVVKPVETVYRGRFPVWYAEKGRYEKGLATYHAFAHASGLGVNEIKHFFKRRRRQYIEYLKANVDPAKTDFIFQAVDGKQFPGRAISEVVSYHLDPMSVQLTISLTLKNGQDARVRLPLRSYLENVFGISVPHLVDQVQLKPRSD